MRAADLWRALPCAVVVLACGSGESDDAASGVPEQAPPAWFESVASECGVNFRHNVGPVRYWFPEVAASGLALFDMDGDGDLDLYALQGTNLAGDAAFDDRNRLYENDGSGHFRDVTESSGAGCAGRFSYGCAVGDYDGDGLLDLYVTNVGPNVLYRNLGDGRFEDVTETTGTAGTGWGASATFLDFDLDGALDLFVVNYIGWSPTEETVCTTSRGQRSYCDPEHYRSPAKDLLLRNRGDGTFEDVSEALGLHAAYGNGLGVVWGRIDDRPGIDLYVANDGMANQLWSRDADGSFEERAARLGCALDGNGKPEAGMGVCLEDLNEDGAWDLVLTHLTGETNTFYMANAAGFRDRSGATGTAGPSKPMTGFGVGLVDFDHDGHRDLYVANGRVMLESTSDGGPDALAEPDQLFRGTGPGTFEELPFASIGDPAITMGRGAAFGDIDDDGDIDVCINDMRGSLRILRNVAPKRGQASTWTVLERDGLPAVGAELRFELNGRRILRQVQRTYSYCASSDPRVHVGYGDAAEVDAVEVTWLDGEREVFGPFPAGGRETLVRGEGRTPR